MNRCTEIIPGLWCGDMRSASDKSFLQSNNIGVVINCTKELKFIDYSHWCLNIKKIRVKIPYSSSYSNESDISKVNRVFYKYLDNTLSFLYESLKYKNDNVLIYCKTGNTVSISIIVAYLIMYGKITKSNAYKCVRSKRKDVPKNNVFDEALSIFENKYLAQ